MNIIELAHRICWRYKHSKDPHHSSTYTFNDRTLLQFAEAVRAEREWVDLTDDEIGTAMMLIEPTGKDYFLRLGRAVIAAFKEKNK